jgi:hypothetical protein
MLFNTNRSTVVVVFQFNLQQPHDIEEEFHAECG